MSSVSFKFLFGHGKWYLLSTLFAKSIQFLLLPVYTRLLTPQELGVQETLLSLNQLSVCFISLYLDTALGRFYHDLKGDDAKISKLVSTIFWFILGWGTLVTGAGLVMCGGLFHDFFKSSIFPLGVLVFFPVILNQLGHLGLVLLRQELKTARFAFFQMSSTALAGITTVLVLVTLDGGVSSRFWGLLAASMTLSLMSTWDLWRRKLLRPTFDLTLLRDSLAFSLPLLPNLIGSWIYAFSDRLFLANFKSFGDVGVYSVAAQISKILYFLQDSVTQVFGVVTLAALVQDEGKGREASEELSYKMFFGMSLMHLLLVLVTPELLLTLGKAEYMSAYRYIPLIAYTYVLSNQYRIFTTIISYKKKTWVISTAAVLSALVAVTLNPILIPRLGAMGTAITILVSSAVYTLWITYWSQRYFPINLKIPQLLGILAAHLLLVEVTMISIQKEIWQIRAGIMTAVICGFGTYYVRRYRSR